ncbi:MAG: DUF933 domain-containing protein, partial [Spirochaetota bacterium]
MKIGLIGQPKSGKTTIFNALTKSEAEVTGYSSGKVEPNLAVVTVDDSRVARLSEMYKPKKTIYATIEVIDFVGVSEGAAKKGLFSGPALGLVRTTDALALVVRNFSDETLDGTMGKADPAKDAGNIYSELILSDLIITENRLEKIGNDYRRGKKTPALQAEEKVLKKIHATLNAGLPVVSIELTEEEAKVILGFQFLSQKPLFVILNSEEKNYGKNEKLVNALGKRFNVIEFAGQFEMELSRLEAEEALVFMQDMGIRESARARLTTFAYQILGYLSFFTVGENEVHAWTIKKGEDAVAAAGTV